MSERAPAVTSTGDGAGGNDVGGRPLADACNPRYTLVVPSYVPGSPILGKYPASELGEVKRLFEEHDPQRRGWVVDEHEPEAKRLKWEDVQ